MTAVDTWTERLHAAQYVKLYRIAADPYDPPAEGASVFDRIQHAARAERQLRDQLAAGHIPEAVVLVASERATPADIGPAGQLRQVFAWAPGSAGNNYTTWCSRHHIVAELNEVHDDQVQPDPLSDELANEGSRLVDACSIRRLVAAHWLSPVTQLLADRYGVHIDVSHEAPRPASPPVQPARAVHIRNALPAGVIEELAELFEQTADYPDLEAGYRPPRPHAALNWAEWGPVVQEILGAIASAYRLPITYASASVMAYTQGDRFEQHTDIVDNLPTTWDRTVSCSALLNQPGQDFEGGELEISGQVVELQRGDVLGFTAATPHAVRPITSGRRLVLVAFGEYHR